MNNQHLILGGAAVFALCMFLIALGGNHQPQSISVEQSRPAMSAGQSSASQSAGDSSWEPGIGISSNGRIGIELAPGIMLDSGGQIGFGTGF